jgi:hypothetical protein
MTLNELYRRSAYEYYLLLENLIQENNRKENTNAIEEY